MSDLSYGEQVTQWQRGLRHQELASMVMDYKHGMRTQIETDAVFEWVRRHPDKMSQFPELFPARRPIVGPPRKRLPKRTMSDDPISV